MLDTYAKLKKWIELEVPKNQRGDAKNVAETAIWFVCLQVADDLYQGTHKDMARMVGAGLSPINTTKHVTEWLEEQYEALEHDEQATKEIDDMLRRHFGI